MFWCQNLRSPEATASVIATLVAHGADINCCTYVSVRIMPLSSM